MRKTKYITSGGLAFSEDKDMEKLRRYSLKGWHVTDFKFMGYLLEKGESSDYIYSVDYRSLKEGEEEEYYDFFSSSEWLHVASQGDIHLFRAHPGTKPIYTDRDTSVEKYENLSGSMKKLTIPLAFITVLTWVATMISSGTLKSLLLVIAVALSVIVIPATLILTATYNHKWRVGERSGLVNLVKTILFSLLLIAVIILLLVDDTSNTVYILTYMIIGAIVFPMAIWVIMSFYHKVEELKWK